LEVRPLLLALHNPGVLGNLRSDVRPLRVAQLGYGWVLSPPRYTASRVVAELRRLLDEPQHAARAAQIAAQM
jgi:hypothetical protein